MDLYLVPVPCFPVEMFRMKMLAQDEKLIEKDNCLRCHHSIPRPGYFFPLCLVMYFHTTYFAISLWWPTVILQSLELTILSFQVILQLSKLASPLFQLVRHETEMDPTSSLGVIPFIIVFSFLFDAAALSTIVKRAVVVFSPLAAWLLHIYKAYCFHIPLSSLIFSSPQVFMPKSLVYFL